MSHPSHAKICWWCGGILAFIRALIRNHPSRDSISLAARSADDKFPITDEQKEAFAEAVAHEVDQSTWPPGFF